MPLTTAKILSNPTKRDWTQSYEDNEGLVVLISLEGGEEENENAVEVGKKASDFFHKTYSKNDAPNLLEKLKTTTTKTCEEFKKYKISLAACVTNPKNYIYFARCGDTQIWAVRAGTIYNLKGENFSGKIQEEDIFLIATNAFFESISPIFYNLPYNKPYPEKLQTI